MSKTTINEYKALCIAISKSYEATENEDTYDNNLKVWRRIYTFMKAITDANAHINGNEAYAEVDGYITTVDIENDYKMVLFDLIDKMYETEDLERLYKLAQYIYLLKD